MNPDHERELWQIRFGKIVELEQESFNFYKQLLTDKGHLLKESGLDSLIKQIMHDEGKHIRIAKELLQIVGGETK